MSLLQVAFVRGVDQRPRALCDSVLSGSLRCSAALMRCSSFGSLVVYGSNLNFTVLYSGSRLEQGHPSALRSACYRGS